MSSVADERGRAGQGVAVAGRGQVDGRPGPSRPRNGVGGPRVDGSRRRAGRSRCTSARVPSRAGLAAIASTPSTRMTAGLARSVWYWPPPGSSPTGPRWSRSPNGTAGSSWPRPTMVRAMPSAGMATSKPSGGVSRQQDGLAVQAVDARCRQPALAQLEPRPGVVDRGDEVDHGGLEVDELVEQDAAHDRVAGTAPGRSGCRRPSLAVWHVGVAARSC